MMHGLQQVCNHPAVLTVNRWPCDATGSTSFDRSAVEFADCPANSGKAARFFELLEEILAPPQEKVLVFTQYLGTLDWIARLVEAQFPGVRVARFHGSMNIQERDAAVRTFSNEPACAVMVVMLQAGGVGLTLTAATHVVHFDRCWNPAKEAQATDRAHRIGQRHTVVVHRFVSSDTFEERLARVVEHKLKLASDAVPVSGMRIMAEYTDAEIRSLFRFGKGPPDSSQVFKQRLSKPSGGNTTIEI